MKLNHSLAASMLHALAVLCGLSLLMAVSAVSAEEIAPDVLVKKVSDEVIEIVRSDADLKAGNTHKATELIEAKVLPHFDFNRMTALSVGRDWRSATPEQKKLLTNEFHALLVRTYSNALTAYKDQTIEFKPFKMAPDENDVIVRTQVKQPGAKPISIDYSLWKNNGTWKVYDVIVGDVSLVISNRDQFKKEISAGGIDGLIKSLQAKNQTPAASVNK
ncbi:MAG: ABC transporter substrate-binding protein [Georgfuchsia sp.]